MIHPTFKGICTTDVLRDLAGDRFRNVAGMDAGVEPTGMYLRRFLQRSPARALSHSLQTDAFECRVNNNEARSSLMK